MKNRLTMVLLFFVTLHLPLIAIAAHENPVPFNCDTPAIINTDDCGLVQLNCSRVNEVTSAEGSAVTTDGSDVKVIFTVTWEDGSICAAEVNSFSGGQQLSASCLAKGGYRANLTIQQIPREVCDNIYGG